MVCNIRPSLSFPKIGFSFLGKNVKADNTTTPVSITAKDFIKRLL